MEETFDVEVADKEENNLAIISNDNIITIAEQAEKRIQAMRKVKLVTLAVTNSYDWTDQNGKPYLQVSGAEKVARIFGISWRINEPDTQAIEGGHYMYTYKGVFSLGNQTIEAIGSRSSKDPFFKKYKWVNNDKIELPPSEIDPGDVKKSAYTNCIGNGVTRLLGIRNLTWDEIETNSDIRRGNVSKVEYKKSGKPQDTKKKEATKQEAKDENPPDEETPQPDRNAEPMSEAQGRMFFALVKSKNMKSKSDENDFRDWLKTQVSTTTNEDGTKVFTKKACSKLFNDDHKVFNELFEQFEKEYLK